MSGKTKRRRIYVVDPGFQYWLIGRMAVLSALIAMASLVLFAYVYYTYGDVTVGLVQPSPFESPGGAVTIGSTQSLWRLLLPILIVCLIGTMVITFVYGVFLSHRMAGPVFRIRKVLSQMAEGDLNAEFSLRKKDAFKPLADSVNELCRCWRMPVRELQQLFGELTAISDGTSRQERLNRMGEILGSFKVE